MITKEEKYLFLKSIVDKDSVIKELQKYTKNKFVNFDKQMSLEDQIYIETWKKYNTESKLNGVFNTLRKYLVELQFPIEKGISKTDVYKNVTLKGRKKIGNSSMKLEDPNLLELEIYESVMVGKVPTLIVPNENDFNMIVCALSYKNEPKKLPKSMGAAFINGINNWNRVYQLKQEFIKNNSFGASWTEEFMKNIISKPYLYKDKIIVLSTKMYSGVSAAKLNISEEFWEKASVTIRKEHECVHLFTLNHYGTMTNNIHDEIVADYAGIVSVLGRFDKKWLLHFLGLEEYPKYRNGGRLQNYKGEKGLSNEAFNGLKILVKRAIEAIAEFDELLGAIKSLEDKLNRIKSICELDLVTMALPNGKESLLKKCHSMYVEGKV